MEALETRVPPPLWAVVFAGVTYGIGQLGIGWEIGGGKSLGFLLAVAGVVIAAVGIIDVFGAGTTVDPHHPTETVALVTTGIYRLTRNPMYLGLAFMILGVGVIVGDALGALLGPAGFVVVITRLQIIPEERVLQRKFPKAYRKFQKRTRRWI